jgi:hypothetical protein
VIDAHALAVNVHAYSALADFGGILRYLLHGSILSEVGASTKPGAVQSSGVKMLR